MPLAFDDIEHVKIAKLRSYVFWQHTLWRACYLCVIYLFANTVPN